MSDTPTIEDRPSDYLGQLEVRSLEQRELVARIIPYGEQIMVRGRPESFAPGAVAGLRATDTVLLRWHDQREPIGRMTQLEERADGAWGTFKIVRTPAGDDALQLVSEGVITDVSPGFIPGLQTADGKHRQLRELPEVSLVVRGAYKNARVLSVRESESEESMTEHTTEVQPVDLSPIETRLDELGAAMLELRAAINAPDARAEAQVPSAFDWFRGELAAVALGEFQLRDRWATQLSQVIETRALDDITGTLGSVGDLGPLVQQELLTSQLVNVLDVRRPLFASAGSFTMPRSGYALIPIVTQHTEVATRSTQKAPANTRKLIVVTTPFAATWFDGAVDVALELIRSAELDVLAMIWEDLLGQYALATEGGIVAFLNSGPTGVVYTGTALPTSTYAAFAAAVATQAMVVRTATGAPASRLAVTPALWPALAAMVDANDRRLLAPGGAVALNAESFTLPGGIEVFPVTGLTMAYLYNESALRVADGGPERVEATNVELMGRDIGLLGRTMVVPRIPGGIIGFGVDPSP